MAKETEVFEKEQCKVNRCELIGSDGNRIDLGENLLEVQVNQSIDAPFMTGYLLYNDSQDIPAIISLNGNELISLSFSQPGLEAIAFERTFRVYRLENRTPVGSSSSFFVLHFCSQEGVTNLTTRVNKAYSERFIAEIVGDILETYLNAKPREDLIEPTVGLYNVVIPDWRPIEAINWCCSRAYDLDNFAYHFYETRDGWNFKSLQSMYNDTPPEYNKLPYTYSVKAVDKSLPATSIEGQRKLENDAYSFEQFKIVQDFDVFHSVGSGAFSTTLLAIDLRNQTFVRNAYNVNEARGRLLNDFPPINDENMINSSESNFSTYVSTEDGPSELGNQINKWFLPSRLHKNLIESVVIDATLPGNVLMKPGTSIFVDLPEMNSANEKGKKFNPMLSGKYLIRDVVQILRKTDDSTFKIFTNLTLCSDSFAEELPTGKNISLNILR